MMPNFDPARLLTQGYSIKLVITKRGEYYKVGQAFHIFKQC